MDGARINMDNQAQEILIMYYLLLYFRLNNHKKLKSHVLNKINILIQYFVNGSKHLFVLKKEEYIKQ